MKQDLISKAVYVRDVGNIIEGFFFFFKYLLPGTVIRNRTTTSSLYTGMKTSQKIRFYCWNVIGELRVCSKKSELWT